MFELNGLVDGIEKLRTENEQLRAENERLREFHQKIEHAYCEADALDTLDTQIRHALQEVQIYESC